MTDQMKAGKKGQAPSIVAPRTMTVGACQLCNSGKCSIMFRSRDLLHGVYGEYTYQRCRECGTVFQDPRVIAEDLPLCYPDEYSPYQSVDELPTPIVTVAVPQTDLRLRARLRKAVMAAVQGETTSGLRGWPGQLLAKSRRLRERAFCYYVIDEMLPFKPGAGYALEVGCGAGLMLRDLAKVGWHAEGVEWNAKAADIARRASGQQVRAGDFQQLDIPRERYDLVVLHHVLEHLPDLKAGLRKIEAILSPGGRAVMAYPNLDSLGAKIFRKDWIGWDPPRHLIVPPARTLVKFAGDSGLNLLRFRSSARYAEWFLTNSRLRRGPDEVKFTDQSITFPDRLLAFCERVLVEIGFHIGEELFVVLEKPHLLNPGRKGESVGSTPRDDQTL